MTKSKLIESWNLNNESLNNGEYIAEADKDHFNFDILNQRSEQTKIHFDMIPQPFWGNIDNPSVLVLFTNPGYKQKEQYQEGNISRIREALLHNLKGSRFDYLEEETFGKHRIKKWSYLNSANYWINSFKDLENSMPTIPVSQFIGEFEFHGYPSRNHKRFYSKRKQEIKGDYLPTQQTMFNHITYLIKRYKPVVLIARAEQLWLEAIPELKDTNYITVSNPQSGSLNKGNLEEKSFERIVKRISEDYEASSMKDDTMKKYQVVYNKLMKFETEIIQLEEEGKNETEVDLNKDYHSHGATVIQIADEMYDLINQIDKDTFKMKTYYHLVDIYSENVLFRFDDTLPVEVIYYMFLSIFYSKDYYIVESSIKLMQIKKIIERVKAELNLGGSI